MIQIKRTSSDDPDFKTLVRGLDAELAQIDGEEHGFYAQYNGIDAIRHVVVLYADAVPVSCGAIKPFAPDAMEVKRMYTLGHFRGKGLASQVLQALEAWAAELGYPKCILETGRRQPDAIALYQKSGYRIMDNYGQYAGVENSVCFEKNIR